MNAKVDKEKLEARREQVRQYLRQGLQQRQIVQLLLSDTENGYLEGYQDPRGVIMKDIAAVRAEDRKTLKIWDHEKAALAEFVGQLEEMYQRAMLGAVTLEGTARVGALNTARELAKDLARARGVDRRLLGEGRDVTLRPGAPTSAEGGGWEEFVLSLRRSRGLEPDVQEQVN